MVDKDTQDDSEKGEKEAVRDDQLVMYNISSRDRGILTEHDRQYLLGEKELDGQDERNARYRIRERTFQSILDMKLIARYLDEDDIRQVLEKLNTHGNARGVMELMYAMSRGVRVPTLQVLEQQLAGVLAENIATDEDTLASTAVSVNIDIDWAKVESADWDRVDEVYERFGITDEESFPSPSERAESDDAIDGSPTNDTSE